MQENSSTASDVTASPAPETGPDTSTNVQRPVRPRRGLRTLAMVVGTMMLAMAFGAGVWALGRSTDSQTTAFGTTIDRIVVENINGRVTFGAGPTSELTVEREWLFTTAPEVEIVESGGILRITGNCGSLCRIHVAGTAPAGTGILVRTDAGSIDITGLSGGVDLTTSAGNVTVTDVAGPAKLRSDAGWIRGDIADGDVDAQTSAGGIDLKIRGDFSLVSAVTNAGSVRLSVPNDVYRVQAETSVGSTRIDVSTDPDAARVIVARSDAGNVTIDRLPR